MTLLWMRCGSANQLYVRTCSVTHSSWVCLSFYIYRNISHPEALTNCYVTGSRNTSFQSECCVSGQALHNAPWGAEKHALSLLGFDVDKRESVTLAAWSVLSLFTGLWLKQNFPSPPAQCHHIKSKIKQRCYSHPPPSTHQASRTTNGDFDP